MEPYEPKHARPSYIERLTSAIARRWLYGVVTAVIPLLVIYGIMEEATAPLWIALAAQVFATGTAYKNTPTPS